MRTTEGAGRPAAARSSIVQSSGHVAFPVDVIIASTMCPEGLLNVSTSDRTSAGLFLLATRSVKETVRERPASAQRSR